MPAGSRSSGGSKGASGTGVRKAGENRSREAWTNDFGPNPAESKLSGPLGKTTGRHDEHSAEQAAINDWADDVAIDEHETNAHLGRTRDAESRKISRRSSKGMTQSPPTGYKGDWQVKSSDQLSPGKASAALAMVNSGDIIPDNLGGGAVERCLALIDDLQQRPVQGSLQQDGRTHPSAGPGNGSRDRSWQPPVSSSPSVSRNKPKEGEKASTSGLSQHLRNQAFRAINSSDDDEEEEFQGPSTRKSSSPRLKGKEPAVRTLSRHRDPAPHGGANPSDQEYTGKQESVSSDEHRLVVEKYTKSKAKRQVLERNLDFITEQKEALETQVQELQDRIAKYEEKENETKSQVENLIERTAELQKQVESMEHARETERIAIQTMKMHNMPPEMQVAALMSQLSSLRSQLQAANSKVFSMEAALILSRQSSDSTERLKAQDKPSTQRSQGCQTPAIQLPEAMMLRLRELETQLDKSMMVETDLHNQIGVLQQMYAEARTEVAEVKVNSGALQLREEIKEAKSMIEMKDLELKEQKELVLVLRRAIKGWEEKYSILKNAGAREKEQLLQDISLLKEQQLPLKKKNQEAKQALEESKRGYLALMNQMVERAGQGDTDEIAREEAPSPKQTREDQDTSTNDSELERLSLQSQQRMEAFRQDHQNFKAQVSSLITHKSARSQGLSPSESTDLKS